MIQFPSDSFFESFKKTPGAISCSEAIAIYNIALQVVPGTYIEAGTNAGKSSMSAALGLSGGTFYLIDPIFDLTNLKAWEHSVQGHPDNLAWGYAKEEGFKEGIIDRVTKFSNGRVKPILLGDYSENALKQYDSYSYVFLDSDNHSKERVFGEIEIIKTKMVKGGIIALHDFKNQYWSPREGHEHLIASGEFENIEINWEEIFDYVRKNDLETGNNSWHEKGSEEFPKFVGACKKL